MREQVDLAAKTWYHDLPHILRKAYNDASEMKALGGPVREPAGHLRFDVLMQPVEGACPRLARIGGEGDGGKLVCGLDRIPHSTANPCIVYSVGGNNNWKFEEDIVRSTSCSVHTFDCTVDGHVPADITDRVHFHKICLGAGSRNSRNTSSTAFMSLKEIMGMLDHDHITLLKMDIVRNRFHLCDESELHETPLLTFIHTAFLRKDTSTTSSKIFYQRKALLCPSKSRLSSTIKRKCPNWIGTGASALQERWYSYLRSYMRLATV